MPSLQSYLAGGINWIIRFRYDRALGSIPELRTVAGGEARQVRIPKGVKWEPVDAGGVRSEWIYSLRASEDAVLFYLHGGGGVLGLSNNHRWMVGHISLACNLRALLPNYRLAPENPFPAGLDDCLTVYRWLLSEGVAPERIVVAGDSAGGYLTISLLLSIRDVRLPPPAAGVCISPNTDPTTSGKSMETNAWKDALLSPKFARTVMQHYVGSHDLKDPHLSPLISDLRGLPPILIQVGSNEVLLDDSMRFADCAHQQGVDLTLEVWPQLWHVWHAGVPYLPEAKHAIRQIANFIHRFIP